MNDQVIYDDYTPLNSYIIEYTITESGYVIIEANSQNQARAIFQRTSIYDLEGEAGNPVKTITAIRIGL